MKKMILPAVLAATFAAKAVAQEANDSNEFNVRPSTKGLLSATEGAEFTIDKQTAAKLYESAVRPEGPVKPNRIGVAVALEGGQIVPSKWHLANRYYETDLADQIDALNSVGFRASMLVSQGQHAATNAFVAADHAARQGVYEVKSVSGVGARADLDIQATTGRLGAETAWRLGSITFLRPIARVDVGATRISQRGSLDGLDHFATLPRAGLSLGAALWPSDWNTAEMGFDGVVVTAGIVRGGASDRRLEGMTWDAGARFAF